MSVKPRNLGGWGVKFLRNSFYVAKSLNLSIVVAIVGFLVASFFKNVQLSHELYWKSTFETSGFIHLKWLQIFEFPKIWKIALRIFQIFEKLFSNFEFWFEKYVKQYLDAYIFLGKVRIAFAIDEFSDLTDSIECAISPKTASI